MREKDLPPIHEKLQREHLVSGARIRRINYCPHHPTDGKPPYNIVCECRKPTADMLRREGADFILQRIHGIHG